MRLWLQVVGLVLLTGATTRVAVACCLGDIVRWRSYRLAAALVQRLRRRRAEVLPLRRPIEQVGSDLYRLHVAFHRGGMRFAKYEGCRQAYDAVLAGLAALHGPRHGGHTARVEALLDEAGTPDGLLRTIRERTRRGEDVPGFGHPLYPDGDPRARELFSAVEQASPWSAATAFVRAARKAAEALGDQPTLDFGLVIVRRALELPKGSALVLFALGRTAGWIAQRW